MVTKTNILVGFILVTLLIGSGIVYLQLTDQVKIRVDKDQTTFYVPHESYSWMWTVAGREQNRLFDGSSIMNRQTSGITVETTIDNQTNEVWIVRNTPYQRGPVVRDTYYFQGNIEDKELFPVSHKIEIFNASGYYYRYTADDLTDTGAKRKLDGETELSFGKNMDLDLQSGYRWAWVGWPYGSDSLSAQYDLDSDYEVFNIRLFDPPENINVTLLNPANGLIQEFNAVTFNATANETSGSSLINMSLYTNETGTWEIRNTTETSTNVLDTHGISFTDGPETRNSPEGFKILIGSSNIYLSNVTKDSTVAATRVLVSWTNGTIITTSTSLGGDTFNFSSPVFLDAATNYYIQLDNSGTDYQGLRYATGGLPVANTYLTWVIRATNSADNGNFPNNIVSLGIQIPVNSSNKNWTRPINGATLWSVEACNALGECNFSLTNWTVNYDEFNPSVSIIYPENDNYINVSFLNYTATDSFPDSCWYSNDSGVTNYSVQTFGDNFTISPTFGEYTYFVYCNDTNNNIGYDSVDFSTIRIKFTGGATNNTLGADFSSQDWIYSEVETHNTNKSNTTFYLYTDTGYFDYYNFTNDTYAVNFTSLPEDFYYFNVTVCYNDSGLCYATDERYYGNLTLNFTINGQSSDFDVELGTGINLSASVNGGNVSFDIDHPDYGINQNSSFINSTLNVTINYFRNNLFSDGGSANFLNFTTQNVQNLSLSSHQYDVVDSIKLNLSAQDNIKDLTIFLVNSTPDVSNISNTTAWRPYVDRILKGNFLGTLLNLDEFTTGETQKNVTFLSSGNQTIYLPIDDVLNGRVDYTFFLDVVGSLFGFSYSQGSETHGSQGFDNYTSIDVVRTTAQLDPSGVIMTKNVTEIERIYDDFGDSSLNTTLWENTTSGVCDTGTSISETGGEAVISSDPSGSCTASLSSKQLNRFESDTINFSIIIPTGNIDNNADSESTFSLVFGGSTFWQLRLIDGSVSGSSTSAANLNVSLNKINKTSWNATLNGIDWQQGDGGTNVSRMWVNNGTTFTVSGSEADVLKFNNFNYDGDGSGLTRTMRVQFVNRTLWTRQNSSLISNIIYDSPTDIDQFNFTFYGMLGPTNASNQSFDLLFSSDGGVTWEFGDTIDCELFGICGRKNATEIQGILIGTFSEPGKQFAYRIDFNSTDWPYENWIGARTLGENNTAVATTQIWRIDIEVPKGTPENVTFDFGADGIIDDTIEGSINETNGTIEVNLSNIDLDSLFTSSNLISPYRHLYRIPLKIGSDSRGLIQLNKVNLTYNPNPLIINNSEAQNRLYSIIFGTNETILRIPFASTNSTSGAADLTAYSLEYDYAGGNKTYEILAHTENYGVNKTFNVTYYFSQWDYNWKPSGVDFLYFNPSTPTSKNVTAYGQTTTVPLMNLTNYGYGGKNATLSALINSSLACVNTTISLTSNKSNGIILNTTFQDLTNLSYLDTVNLSFWADYDCSYSNWYTYTPYLYFRECVEGGVCSTQLV